MPSLYSSMVLCLSRNRSNCDAETLSIRHILIGAIPLITAGGAFLAYIPTTAGVYRDCGQDVTIQKYLENTI